MYRAKRYSMSTVHTYVLVERQVSCLPTNSYEDFNQFNYFCTQGICRMIHCPPLTVLDHGTCRRVVSETTGLNFEATIKLTRSSHSRDVDSELLIQGLEKYFEHIAKNCTTPVTVNLRSKNTSDARINQVKNLDMFSAFIRFRDDISFADRLFD